MTTSGTTTFKSTENYLIADALRILNVIREDNTAMPEDYSFGNRLLNRMVKAWQADGVHLWTKNTATLFLQKGQAEYLISSTSTDHAALDYTETSLDTPYTTGTVQISFNDSVSVSVGDNIGIVLDSGSLYWDTIAVVVDADTIDLTGTLPSAAAQNNAVYIYTTNLDEPFNVYSGTRQSADDTETPMYYMTYQEYFELPNKTSESTPVNYNYDRQLDTARIVVWPVPADVSYRMQFTMDRKIDDFVSLINTADFPQEWEEAIVLNLAIRMAPAYGKAEGNQFVALKGEAQEAYQRALRFDSESGSIFLQPETVR